MLAMALVAMVSVVQTAEDVDSDFPVIPNLPATPTISASTIPANGDVNPYGVAFVPAGFPANTGANPGDVLVSNFNNSANTQGTGTTIVRIAPDGTQTLFAQNLAPGLSTALGVLQAGFVIVGNLPSPSGMCTPGKHGTETGVGQGSLEILDANGNLIETLASAAFLNGPWDLTVNDLGATAQVFVSNALDGTVTRIDLHVSGGTLAVDSMTRIASGYTHRCDPNALVVGPTGLAFDPGSGVLYVAATGNNAIFALNGALSAATDLGKGKQFINDPKHLHGPLGLALAPNGDLITSQGDAVNPDPNQPSEIVEYSPAGRFIAQFSIDPAPGSAFGLAIVPLEDGFSFAAVDDGLNVLDLWNVP